MVGDILLRDLEFLDVSNLLGQGFFADRVVGTLSKEGPIDPSDEAVLKRVKEFIEKITQGQRQVSAERLSNTTLETLDAYQQALIVFSQTLRSEEPMTKNSFESKFDELTNRMTEEVERILERKFVKSEAKTTLLFFKVVQQSTMNDTSEYISRRTVLRWPKPTPFCRF